MRLFILLVLLGFASCKPEGGVPVPNPEPVPTGRLSLKLQHFWENPANTFYPETWYVHSATTDSFLFNKLRYYLSGFYLLTADGQQVPLPAAYRLVAVNGGVFSVDLNDVPTGQFAGMGFYLGIDSANNFSAQFAGELHPDYGMHRNAQEGFNFLWATGITPAAPNDSFEYRLYGFDALHPVHRRVEVLFGQERLQIAAHRQPELGLYVNTAAFWGAGAGPSHRHSILQPGAEAAALAQRFVGAFAFEHIHQ
ncbi:MAG: hypothetical protein C0424_01860 [Sphingobacteriaceae bacterium]|nr:hypothetical protein [Sphingobacteriaceae bacterium]